MHDHFGLVLMVTHACNLRCSYCYTGARSRRSMRVEVARKAIDRAVASTRPRGALELGFFGGEPLLVAGLITGLVMHARERTAAAGLQLRLSMTTSGTLAAGGAWALMIMPDMELSVSHDGLPEIHDRHRRDAAGCGTSQTVLQTIRRLRDAGSEVRVVMVVRPDSVASLPDGIAFLREQGVRYIEPALDLWTTWGREDAAQLQAAIARCADLWLEGLPECGISWFDEKAARLAGVLVEPSARCGFGDGSLAVAPSGNLYPCERLIGEDRSDNPMRLAGHALAGDDFRFPAPPGRSAAECAACEIHGQCNTTCRCSNYVRTGAVQRPDGLLCLLDQACHRETARVLRKLPIACDRHHRESKEACHVE